ncbi:MAG TPA: GNAT family N-acetyltransferase [Firmicutes bacterium]|jgi:hypothetical protein|nr:GNAT family N-acetyltransferase [Bacillota bacterium]
MEIRHTTLAEIDPVMDIYDNARLFMRKSGNCNQWVHGYPGLELINNDILHGNSFVCLESSRIAGVFTFIQGMEPTYLQIHNGTWLNDEAYGVVHRIASAGSGKGVATHCLNWCLDQCKNVRIDTHRDNVAMQNLLAKNNFVPCGIIYLADGSERLAYQKIIRQYQN